MNFSTPLARLRLTIHACLFHTNSNVTGHLQEDVLRGLRNHLSAHVALELKL